MTQNLKIAIQKSGRLNEKSIEMLRKCGIQFENGDKKLKCTARNFPLEILFLRDDDIPQYVAEGIADLGILGQNVLREKRKEVKEILPLGFAKCRLSLAVPRDVSYENTRFFSGKRIATSYPRILGAYMQEKNIDAFVEEITGSVEIAPGIGLAEGVCDIVSTGSTLQMNGLREVEVVMKSEAVLISSATLSAQKEELLGQLLFRIKAVLSANRNKYIMLNAPNESVEAIAKLLPGMKSPTIIPLTDENWSSMQSVISEDDFWEIIDQLKNLGAQGILVTPIEKMVL